MRLLLTEIINPLKHSENTVNYLCKKLNVRVTRTGLQKDLLEHPDYPSLLAISDVLKNYGIENAAFKMDRIGFKALPLPFVVHMKGKEKNDVFGVVTDVDNYYIKMYDPDTKLEKNIEAAQFDEFYNGLVLAVEVLEKNGEKKFEEKRILENKKELVYRILTFFFPTITLLACVISAFSKQVTPMLFPVLFTVVTLFGAILCITLFWFEVDKYNPVAEQVCRPGAKKNCTAILNSKAATFLGISWSTWGAAYFIGSLLHLLVVGIANKNGLALQSWMCILMLPYVFFSLYYQWKVAKQWCVLCLGVQAVLILQNLLALAGGFYQLVVPGLVPFQSVFILFLFLVFVLLLCLLLIPALEKARDNKSKTISLQRLKHNPHIFNALLTQQKNLTLNPNGLGITIGNPNATHKLIKVCNPYCGPCASAHFALEELVAENENLQLQIIFTATNNENDKKAPPVKHLLAIAEKGDQSGIKKALDDWYGSEKNYAHFAEIYPINDQLEKQNHKLNAMQKWCTANEISFTPTFFINGYQLPKMYTVADLKYFLAD